MKKKIVFTVFISLFLSTAAFSQLGVKGGLALGEPINDDVSNLHAGFDVGLTYTINESFRTEIVVEALFREIKDSYSFSNSFSRIFPITVGVDYRFLAGMIQPYAGLNLGLVSIGKQIGNTVYSDLYFGLHPKAGVDIEVADNLFIDVAIKYHVVFNNSSVNASNTQIFGANIGLIYVFN